MRERGMKQDFSWDNSANAYANVYRWAIEARHSNSTATPMI